MKKRIFLLISSMLILLLISCNSNKVQRLSYKETEPYMYGMVYDYENKPVESAQVFINGEYISSTDVQGRFILNYQMDENNEIVLKVQKNGYEVVETSFLFDPINVLYIKLINTQQLLLLAEECMANLEFSEAEILLKRALCLTPDRDDIKYLLCISLYKQDKKDEALKNIEKLNKKVIPNSYIEGLKNKITNEEATVNK